MMQTIGLFVTLVLLLTACANVDDQNKESNRVTEPFAIEYHPNKLATPNNQYANREVLRDINTLRSPNEHFMTNLAFNQRLSNVVSDIVGVNSAWVLVANKRAYVAIILDATATGGRSGDKTHMRGTLPPAGNTDRVIQDYTAKDLIVPEGAVATPMNTKRALGDVALELKMTIAKEIGKQDRSIQEVYVSANRNFINESNRIVMKAWKGQSLRGDVNKFEKLVQKTLSANPKEVTFSSSSELIRQGTKGQSGGVN